MQKPPSKSVRFAMPSESSRPSIVPSTAIGNIITPRITPGGCRISGNRILTTRNGEQFPCPPTSKCTVTAFRSTSISGIRGHGTAWLQIRRSCRKTTRTTPSIPIVTNSTCPGLERTPHPAHVRRGQFVLLALDQRAKSRPGQGQPHTGRVRHHPISSSPARTCWPSKISAGATARIWKTRTCGA